MKNVTELKPKGSEGGALGTSRGRTLQADGTANTKGTCTPGMFLE